MVDQLAAALAHHRAGRLPEAEALYRAHLAQAPDHPGALYGLGTLELQAGRPAAAAHTLKAALDILPEARRGAVHQALGAAYRQLQDPAAALGHYRRAADLAPASAVAALNLGAALGDAGLYGEAADAFARARMLDPAMAAAHEALAATLNRLGRHGEAEAVCRQGLSRAADWPALIRALGIALKEQDLPEEAAAAFDRLLQLAPADADALYNLASIHKDQGRTEIAVQTLRRVLQLAPDHAAARIALCMAHLPPLYTDEGEVRRARAAYADELAALAAWADTRPPEALADGVGAAQPFSLAYQGENDIELQRLYGRLMHRAMAARYPPVPLAAPPGPGQRVRVGFVSGFFRDHANWRMPVRGWVEGLDRARFELFGYHTGAAQDAETDRIRAMFDHFVQGPLSTEAWRARIAADRPHVLIYPEVGMDPAAVRLAAQRLAPAQCNSWGHPTTSGLPTLDYFLSSDDMEPPDAQSQYSETLVRLPGLSTAVRLPQIPPVLPHAALGVDADTPLFWCGQSLYKYLPRHDAVFARIAARLPEARFVFLAFPGSAELTERFRRRLQAAFAQEGLEAERACIILPRLSPADYRAAMNAADVMLDSLGWSGCNSITDALACGLPVVTLEGDTLRGRHGAALLRRWGLHDHVCQTLDAYVALAVDLAERRKAARAHVRALAAHPLPEALQQAPAADLASFLERVAAKPGAGLVTAG